jgi:hypothetical protein
MAGDDWRRLGEAVQARMRELGIADQADLIRATRLSPPTVKGILDGVPRSANARAKTYQQLDDGLSWERGSTAAVLAGGAPVAHDVKRGGVSSPGDAVAEMEERLRSEIGAVDARLRALEESLRLQLEAMVAPLEALADRLEQERRES